MRHPVLPVIAGLPLLALLGRAAAQSSVSASDVQQLREQLAQVEHQAQFVPLLAGVVVVLCVAVAVLAWQLWRRRSPPAIVPLTSAAPAPAESASPVQEPAAEPDTAPDVDRGEHTTAAVPMSVTVAQPPAAAGSEHGLSIEEAIDVDQQAQFLVVLGQDEAAIDLLLDHLRGTGGTSPLPYLRLMQIYRKRGDEAAYERTRERFDLRFNAVAPSWRADPANQQALEAYPAALAEVQRAWASPLDAMAVIESLLFRRGTEDERFDLPAYEELLFLYWLTRELQQRADNPPSQVDVLLPLDEQVSELSVIEHELPSSAHYERVDLDLSTVPGPADDYAER